MKDKTGKPLPTQMLRMFLRRAAESAIAGNQPAARGFATTLEKIAYQIRATHGGDTFVDRLYTVGKAPPLAKSIPAPVSIKRTKGVVPQPKLKNAIMTRAEADAKHEEIMAEAHARHRKAAGLPPEVGDEDFEWEDPANW